jgi:hypothetical protein
VAEIGLPNLPLKGLGLRYPRWLVVPAQFKRPVPIGDRRDVARTILVSGTRNDRTTRNLAANERLSHLMFAPANHPRRRESAERRALQRADTGIEA